MGAATVTGLGILTHLGQQNGPTIIAGELGGQQEGHFSFRLV